MISLHIQQSTPWLKCAKDPTVTEFWLNKWSRFSLNLESCKLWVELKEKNIASESIHSCWEYHGPALNNAWSPICWNSQYSSVFGFCFWFFFPCQTKWICLLLLNGGCGTTAGWKTSPYVHLLLGGKPRASCTPHSMTSRAGSEIF